MNLPETFEELKNTKVYQVVTHPKQELAKLKKLLRNEPETVETGVSPLTVIFIVCAVVGFLSIAALTAYILFRKTARKYMDIR